MPTFLIAQNVQGVKTNARLNGQRSQCLSGGKQTQNTLSRVEPHEAYASLSRLSITM